MRYKKSLKLSRGTPFRVKPEISSCEGFVRITLLTPNYQKFAVLNMISDFFLELSRNLSKMINFKKKYLKLEHPTNNPQQSIASLRSSNENFKKYKSIFINKEHHKKIIV